MDYFHWRRCVVAFLARLRGTWGSAWSCIVCVCVSVCLSGCSSATMFLQSGPSGHIWVVEMTPASPPWCRGIPCTVKFFYAAIHTPCSCHFLSPDWDQFPPEVNLLAEQQLQRSIANLEGTKLFSSWSVVTNRWQSFRKNCWFLLVDMVTSRSSFTCWIAEQPHCHRNMTCFKLVTSVWYPALLCH